MRRIAIIGASLVLTACATPEQNLSAHLDSNLDAIVGQPVAVAVDRLGEPSDSARIGTDTVYSWREAFKSTVTSPEFPRSRWSEVVDNECLIQAVVSPNGLIRYWHFEGNYAGCHSYAERLSPMAQAGIE